MGLYGTRRALLKGRRTYSEKVLGYAPIAYWPLWEATGTTAQCLVNSAQNGTYTGVTLANALGPDGSRCPFFDGANDYVTLPSAYYSAMNHATGSIILWAQAGTGVWVDSTFRWLYSAVETNVAGNRLTALRHSDNNVLYHARDSSGGNTNTYPVNTGGPAGFFHWADTWSLSGNAIESFFNGVTANSGGATALAGTPNAAFVGIATGATPWKGWMAHVAVFDRVLSPATILDLATV